jgi:hypothetical protein
MPRFPLRPCVAALLLGTALAGSAYAQPKPASSGVAVDVELVLAVDVSRSMDPEEQAIQRKGYADAFRHPAIASAIRNGSVGKIAVTYVEWAATAQQTIPWVTISNERDARAFAAMLDKAPLWDARRTSISNALATSAALINTNAYQGTRKVIDISGDGPNNAGAPIDTARQAVIGGGIIINGLPIVMRAVQQYSGPGGLEGYYKDCVIGGRGAFVLPVRDIKELASTIRAKLVTEIADLVPPNMPYAEEPMFKPAQARVPARPSAAKPAKTNCAVSEGIAIGRGYQPGVGNYYEPGIVVQGRRGGSSGR